MNTKKILFIIGFVIFMFLLWKYQVFENISYLNGRIQVTYLIFCILLLNLVIVLKALRWKYLMQTLSETTYSFKESLLLIGFGSFIATITPLRAGEISKIAFFKGTEDKIRGRTLVGFEYLSDVCAFFVYSSFLLMLYLSKKFPLAAVLFLIFAISILLLREKIRALVFSILIKKKYIRKEYLQLLNRLFTTKLTFFSVSVGIINLFIFGIIGYLVFYSLGISITFLTTLMGLVFSQIVGILTLIPLGLGTRELSALWFFSNYGIEEIVIHGLIIIRLLTFFQIACLYGLYLIKVSKST